MTKNVDIRLDADERKYLGQLQLTENDPGLVFHWHIDNIQNVVAAANAPPPPAIVVPTFIQQPVTVSSFMSDMITHIGLAGGGTFGSSVVAPNNPTQYAAVLTRLAHMETLPWFQHVGGAHHPLATVGVVADRQALTRVEPLHRFPPYAPNVRLFD